VIKTVFLVQYWEMKECYKVESAIFHGEIQRIIRFPCLKVVHRAPEVFNVPISQVPRSRLEKILPGTQIDRYTLEIIKGGE